MFSNVFMERILIYNPPSLSRLCVCRVRQAISCVGQNVERNLVGKLTSGDCDDLRNPNVPISLEDMCVMERKFVLDSCLTSGEWGLLEMYILLTEDIVEFDGGYRKDDYLERFRRNLLPAINIKLDYREHHDLFLLLLTVRCPKLKSLTLDLPNTSHTALEKFCVAMSNITKLNLSSRYDNNRYDGVLRAISANMRHLKSLNISYWMVDLKSIEYLLPTEDNALGGCPELVELDLRRIQDVHLELLKKIILALPKLRSLRHRFVVAALESLTEEDVGVDTARFLNIEFDDIDSSHPINYGVLAKSPIFQRVINNITTAHINVPKYEKGLKEFDLVIDLLVSLPKLRSLQLNQWCTLGTYTHVLSLLESIGHRLVSVELYLYDLDLWDIMKTCPNLENLTFRHSYIMFGIPMDIQRDQVETPSPLPVLNYIRDIDLSLDKKLCSAEMLIALLQSPCLNKIDLRDVEAMSDDVMWNVFSSGWCTALSKVTEFSVHERPLITAAPFVQWLNRENCSLQYLSFIRCENVDCEIVKAAAEKCPRAIIIDEVL